MPQIVRELMTDAIREGLPMLAHSLFIAIQERIISAEDNANDIQLEKFPIEKCIAATKNNVLGIHPTYLFAIPIEDYFAMYLAKTEKDAKDLHYKLFRKPAIKVFDMTEKIDTDLYDETTKKVESFSEIRDKTVNFPKFVCCMQRKRR